jgi:hypothetical protein
MNAVNLGDNVSITWSTAKEENNDVFVIQRSIDGITFTSIGTVKGMGTKNETSHYKFLDESPVLGQNFYRVVQYDINRDFSNSPVVAVNVVNDIFINVSPNPSSGEFKLNISGTSEASYSIFDVLGRELENDQLNILDEGAEFNFGSNLKQGTYILRVIANDQVYTHKLIKE